MTLTQQSAEYFITVSWTFKLISSKALELFFIAEVHRWTADHIWSFGKWFQCQYNDNSCPGVTLWYFGAMQVKIFGVQDTWNVFNQIFVTQFLFIILEGKGST